MTKLWDYVDGEPFMINSPLMILNKRKIRRKVSRSKTKKGSRMAARRKRRVGRPRKMTPQRRRSTRKSSTRRTGGLKVRIVNARRNAYPLAGVVANPRRRRRSRSRYRRNPALLGVSLPPVQTILFTGVGFVAPPMIEGFISRFLPVEFSSSTIGKYAVKIASVIGLSFLTRQFIGGSEARMVAVGGSAYVLTAAVSEFMPDLLPRGLGAYTPINRQLGSYSRAIGPAPAPAQLGAPAFGAQNTSRFAQGGAANIVGMRFRRFQ